MVACPEMSAMLLFVECCCYVLPIYILGIIIVLCRELLGVLCLRVCVFASVCLLFVACSVVLSWGAALFACGLIACC
jgi:hypothetical protein